RIFTRLSPFGKEPKTESHDRSRTKSRTLSRQCRIERSSPRTRDNGATRSAIARRIRQYIQNRRESMSVSRRDCGLPAGDYGECSLFLHSPAQIHARARTREAEWSVA